MALQVMAVLLLQPKEVGVLLAVVLIIRLLGRCGWQHGTAVVRGAAGWADLATASLPAGLR